MVSFIQSEPAAGGIDLWPLTEAAGGYALVGGEPILCRRSQELESMPLIVRDRVGWSRPLWVLIGSEEAPVSVNGRPLAATAAMPLLHDDRITLIDGRELRFIEFAGLMTAPRVEQRQRRHQPLPAGGR